MSGRVNTLSAGRPSARTDKAKAVTLASLANGTAKRINFDLSIDQYTKLKVHVAKRGKTIKELLTDYVVSLPE